MESPHQLIRMTSMEWFRRDPLAGSHNLIETYRRQSSTQVSEPKALAKDKSNNRGPFCDDDDRSEDARLRMRCRLAVSEAAKQYNEELSALKRNNPAVAGPEAAMTVDRDDQSTESPVLQSIAERSKLAGVENALPERGASASNAPALR